MHRVRTWILAAGVLLTAAFAGGIAAGTTVEACQPDEDATAGAPDERVPVKCYRNGDLYEIRCPDGFRYDVAVNLCVVPAP